MPDDLLEPYRSPADGPWDRVQAAHVLRRGGFQPNETEIREAIDAGPADTVERMVDDAPESRRHRDLDPLGESIVLRNDIHDLAAWWIGRMVHTANPLAARMAVFWHNHFATSNVKVGDASLMLGQLRVLERHALGSFERLLMAVARDPAMIVWLDGASNHKGRPNENFARELLELFTLGVGHYTERDIKEVARAFTGWHQRRGSFHFNAGDHDTKSKTLFGETGDLDGADVIPLVLKQPAAAEFLARKLAREFVNDTPAESLVAALADVIRGERFDLRAVLRVLLGSRAMFAPSNYRARVSSPVEFVVGTIRALEMRMDMKAAARATGEMGQRLFEPPTVKGWDGGRTWINSTTMLVRMNVAAAASRQRDDGVGFDAAKVCGKYDADQPAEAAAFLYDLLLDGRVPAPLRSEIGELVNGGGAPEQAVRTMVRLIVGSPEYQLA